MRILCISMLVVMWCGQVNSKSFGVVGEVFPIAEKSFLKLIEERLQVLKTNGEIEALNERWLHTVAAHANRPAPLNLSRTTHSITHHFIPETRVSQDITDERARVLYAKGMTVNALTQMPSYQPCWLFFNADDEAQLKWARHQQTICPNPKLILTGGAIATAEKNLQAVIYFDQAGKITSKLHIAHVPAKVTRRHNHLVIHEVAIKENGDVV